MEQEILNNIDKLAHLSDVIILSVKIGTPVLAAIAGVLYYAYRRDLAETRKDISNITTAAKDSKNDLKEDIGHIKELLQTSISEATNLICQYKSSTTSLLDVTAKYLEDKNEEVERQVSEAFNRIRNIEQSYMTIERHKEICPPRKEVA